LSDIWDLVEVLEEIVFMEGELRRPGDDGKSLQKLQVEIQV
jgi:hypothetical protein